MEIMPWEPKRPAAMQLAKASPFQLNSLRVDPSARTVSMGECSETLEPRVMRVLVALGETPGQVLSRDDLIELCWDGQIVTDNAINRVISLLRRALDHLADGAVRLETITKVGFRIVVEGAEQAVAELSSPAPVEVMDPTLAAPVAPQRNWTRRAAIGGAVVAGAALVYAVAPRMLHSGPDPRAKDLYDRGQFLIKTGDVGTARQAMDFLKEAVKIDPDYADAWGALAASYIHNLDGFALRERVAAPELARSAAKRALSLDPDQPDALLALAIPLPHFRRWLEHEKPLRDLVRRFPNYWYGHAQLGILLLDVGRAGEAAERFRRVLDIEPMLPAFWLRFAGALNMAGRQQEADLAFDEALSRWPTNLFIRVNRFATYIDSKRYAEAIAFLRDRRNVPDDVPMEAIDRGLSIAESLKSGTGFEKHVEAQRWIITHAEAPELSTAPTNLFWFGAVDLGFELLEAIYFGGVVEGRRIPPPDPTARRSTAYLFGNAILDHRADPRFLSILKRIGLEDYWRKSGTQPDYRKADRVPSAKPD